MSTEEFEYTGRENLEVMEVADNYNDFLMNFVLGRMGEKKNFKVLDFGAGSGTYADLLKRKGITPECLEPDTEQYQVLKKKGYIVHKDIDKLKSNSFDIIYAFNVFEHIKDDKETLMMLKGALKDGGRIIVYVPAFQVLYTNMDKLVGHHRRYRIERLRDHAHASGLKIELLQYCDPLGFFAALAYKYVGNKNGTLSKGSVKFYDRLIFPLSRLLQPVFSKYLGKNVVLIAEKQ